MISLRKSDARGHFDWGWLDTRHSFSFGDYYDPQYMGWSDLRVINEDIVAPGTGFPTHGHKDMEIITYVIDGEIEHKDSTGTAARIAKGEIQRMSAGTGIRHSEYNASSSAPLHLLQIWVHPESQGIAPGYEQVDLSRSPDAQEPVRLIGSREGGAGQVKIHQDLNLYSGLLMAGQTGHVWLGEKRKAWVQVVSGAVNVNGVHATAGDGVAVSEHQELVFVGDSDAEFLVFDLRG